MGFEYRFHLGMSSVDAAGVMFFAELLRHAHDAYEAFMRAEGYELGEVLADGQYLLPIRQAKADYLYPMGLGSDFVVHIGVSRIGGSSFNIVSRFVDVQERTCARAETLHVCVHRATGRSVTLPDALRNALQCHEVESGV